MGTNHQGVRRASRLTRRRTRFSLSVASRMLKPTPNDLLQRWPVSKRVNSSRASDDDPTLIEEIDGVTL